MAFLVLTLWVTPLSLVRCPHCGQISCDYYPVADFICIAVWDSGKTIRFCQVFPGIEKESLESSVAHSQSFGDSWRRSFCANHCKTLATTVSSIPFWQCVKTIALPVLQYVWNFIGVVFLIPIRKRTIYESYTASAHKLFNACPFKQMLGSYLPSEIQSGRDKNRTKKKDT